MPKPEVRLFDTHAHFFTNDTANFPVDLTGAREGEEALRRRIESNPASAERLLAIWDSCGVTGGAAVQYNTVYKTDNRYAVATADTHPDRVSAVLILNATDPTTPGTLRELAQNHNVRGLRLFGPPEADGTYAYLESPTAMKTWEEAAALGLSMVLMYTPGTPSSVALRRIKFLAERFAPMTIALDHCGWPAVDKGARGAIGPEHLELAGTPNISFKFTQINLNRFRDAGLDAAEFVRHAVDSFGADRVMWGSDYGNTRDTYAEMVAQAIAATKLLDASERDRVLHDNGRRLFAAKAR